MIQEYYLREFGERKLRAIAEKISSSNKIASFIKEAELKRVIPKSLDILTCLNTIPYFIFSRGQTQVIGALLVLHLWDTEINSSYYLADEFDLKNIAINIIKESASTFS